MSAQRIGNEPYKQTYANNVREYCAHTNGTDKDLAAHFTIIKKAGMTLYGDAVGTIFGGVPVADYLDSIKGDIEDAVEEIQENPVYNVNAALQSYGSTESFPAHVGDAQLREIAAYMLEQMMNIN